MRRPVVLDVSDLPAFAFGARATLWWGVWGLIAIEGTMFGLLIASVTSSCEIPSMSPRRTIGGFERFLSPCLVKQSSYFALLSFLQSLHDTGLKTTHILIDVLPINGMPIY